jgi:hypothetical protein
MFRQTTASDVPALRPILHFHLTLMFRNPLDQLPSHFLMFLPAVRMTHLP